ncbi:YebC/PmpR family DNA-binding transcriptional regulator [Lyngbya confervoides]|uniref:Probable transcriptional regulatory protein QQ91_0008515 n=1 Tax=Lyngbya confervoides BDU141951 TaxID=1574623 RepID=A0ABD4T2V8_9CYAN|nr:YebC/PmpR family DNA-binding transcriptional regulator [Lyngbya confervoides]MCM1982864.1 YebC/PmpR family DNA-binding transcriptional regulator [Lyngbya confervoides BDU141951]
MAGHSKWANIKRQKARVDAKKGQVFARLSRAIIVAARHGLPDPDANFQLRSAIEKAKAAGIPNENIDRAIAKGSGQWGQDGDDWEEIRYEGYGPGGVAVLIEAMTDNRNRTAADLRSAFSKQSGNLGETGCVSWMFNQMGVVTLQSPPPEEALLELLLEVGASSYEFFATEATAEVYTEVNQLDTVAQTLKQTGCLVENAELRWIPQSTVTLEDPETAQQFVRLMEALEDLDDVQTVTANAELDQDWIEASDSLNFKG